MDFVSFDPYKNQYEGIEKSQGKKYDVLVVFQIMPPPEFLENKLIYEQGVFSPCMITLLLEIMTRGRNIVALKSLISAERYMRS